MIVRTAKKDARASRKGAVAWLGLASLLIATGFGCSCGSSDSEDEAGPSAGSAAFMPSPTTHPPGPRLGPGRLVITREGAVGPIAVDARHLVWETGPIEEGGGEEVLFQRDLRTGRTTRLAEEVNRSYGLASTSGRVVYVAGPDGRTVIAVDHRGSRERVLSDSITAPLASRGDLVAWAEDDGTRQRVIVRDMARGQQWTAADVLRCNAGRCFRLDAVALADRGVVFSRGAIGSHPSVVVRRAFSAPRATAVRVANDPQPDLVPSSSGALYYAFSRGWYRWDFGEAKPQRVDFPGAQPATVLGEEGGRSLLVTSRRCQTGVTATGGRRRAALVASAEQVRGVAGETRDACVQLTGFAWAGARPLTAWVLISEEEEEEHHADEGAVGVLIAGKALR